MHNPFRRMCSVSKARSILTKKVSLDHFPKIVLEMTRVRLFRKSFQHFSSSLYIYTKRKCIENWKNAGKGEVAYLLISTTFDV